LWHIFCFQCIKFDLMKTKNIRIPALLLIAAGILLISFPGHSQEEKLTKQEMKALRKAESEMNFRILDSLLTSRRFVLVADFLQNKYGDRISVLQSLNFVRVNVTNGVLQTGTGIGYGSNSVGGTTAEGSLSLYSIDRDKKSMSFNVSFGLNTQIGHYDVTMTVTSGNFARATITGSFPGKLTWEGHLETLENNSVFKGVNSI
jgi:hypothetical protein